MRLLCLSLALLALLARSSGPGQIGSAIDTPIDRWRPVSPGTWRIKSIRSDSPSGQPPATTTSSACPYSALLFLNNMANTPIGESACRYETHQVSQYVYHIVAHCKALRGSDHFETTT